MYAVTNYQFSSWNSYVLWSEAKENEGTDAFWNGLDVEDNPYVISERGWGEYKCRLSASFWYTGFRKVQLEVDDKELIDIFTFKSPIRENYPEPNFIIGKLEELNSTLEITIRVEKEMMSSLKPNVILNKNNKLIPGFLRQSPYEAIYESLAPKSFCADLFKIYL